MIADTENTRLLIDQLREHILNIRGEKVMLDAHLAKLYGVETKVLLQAIKRNLDRFPPDFMFQVNEQELGILRSQFVTSSWGGRRYQPYAFTEQGVAMLSSVLHSKQAIQVNIAIMRAFVQLRKMIDTHKDLKQSIRALEKKYDERFRIVFTAIDQLIATEETDAKQRIGF